MPNHVTTILEAPKEVIDFLKSEGSEVDFNTVIPQPDDNDPVFTAERHEYKNKDGEVWGVGYSLGGYSPMDWARSHWGTKWNAYDIERPDETHVQFDTAWNHPDPVISALSLKFPDADLHVKYADEDTGYNLGEYWMTNGTLTQELDLEDGSDEALDFASWIKYGKSYTEVKAEWDAEEHEWAMKNNDPCECGVCEQKQLESNETKQIEA